MAITGVLRPGHMQLKVLDLDEAVEFYSNVVGLVQTGRDATRAYFKGWDERDHHSLILRDAGEAGMDFYGFKVADDATLATLEADLKNYGVTTERVPAGDLLETGERVRFQIPSGHLIELYSQKTDVGNGMGYINPPPWNEAAERGIAPIRMDHALLYGPDIEKVQALFVDVLGFYLVEHILLEDGKSMNRVTIDMGPTRHGVTRGTTIYAFDNSGNRFETFCGGYQSYPDWEPLTWTWDEVGPAVFYHDRKLNPAFLGVYT